MSTDDTEVRLGAAQVSEVYLDREATIEKACEYIRRAGEMGVDLLVFPEMFVPGFYRWYKLDDDYDSFTEYYKVYFDNAVEVPSPATDRLCNAAAEAGTAAVVGMSEKEPQTAGTMYNSQLFVDSDGTLLGTRRKLRATIHDRLFHTGGDGRDVDVFDSNVGRLSGMMCGEHTNHLLSYALQAQNQELHAAAWPAFFFYEDDDVREDHIGIRTRFHAKTGQLPTAVASGVVTEEFIDDIGADSLEPGYGTSSIVGVDGSYLAGPVYEGEQILTADVDLGDRTRSKAKHDVIGHYNRFDIFQLSVDRSSQPNLRLHDDAESRATGSTAPDAKAAVDELRRALDGSGDQSQNRVERALDVVEAELDD